MFVNFENLTMQNMKHRTSFPSCNAIIFIFLFIFSYNYSSAQSVVGLDNWFNRETNAKTGEPYHYLWSDREWSGYSRWGGIFESRGAVITTVEKPTTSVLSGIDVYIIVDPDTTTESKSPELYSCGRY